MCIYISIYRGIVYNYTLIGTPPPTQQGGAILAQELTISRFIRLLRMWAVVAILGGPGGDLRVHVSGDTG